jgi:hypothetical protein
MIVTIKKGSHYSSGFSLGSLHTGTTQMGFLTRFDESGLLLPGRIECDGDFNKLFGWSHGMHHTNSFRLGWKAIDTQIVDGKIVGTKYRISAYAYINGTRYIKGFATILPNETHMMSITRRGSEVVFACGAKTHVITYNGPTGWGYNLKPYYGGNCTAPQDITISLI